MLADSLHAATKGGISARPAGSTDETLHQFLRLKKRRERLQLARGHIQTHAVQQKHKGELVPLDASPRYSADQREDHECHGAT